MGFLSELWDANYDPSDTSNPSGAYVAYQFAPAGAAGPVGMSLSRDFARRESVQVVPGLDGVLDGFGRAAGPMERRDVTFSFRVFTDGDNDAAYDRLAAQVAPGRPQRLVYRTDSGALWFTVGSDPRIRHTLAAANSWGHGGYCDFEVTWRIRPDWRPRNSETAQVFRAGTTFAAGTTFGSLGATTIASAFQPFNVDATGTAGLDLPTLDDSGPTITVVGPAGGDGGFRISSGTAFAVDASGARRGLQFDVPYKLVDGNQSVTLKCAGQTFLYNGIPFRPTRPDYQREWFRIKAGVVNGCLFSPLGANSLVGGHVTVDFWRKRA